MKTVNLDEGKDWGGGGIQEQINVCFYGFCNFTKTEKKTHTFLFFDGILQFSPTEKMRFRMSINVVIYDIPFNIRTSVLLWFNFKFFLLLISLIVVYMDVIRLVSQGPK